MLTREDLKWNFILFKVMTVLNICPIHFDPSTGKIKLKTGIWSKIIFKLWQLFILSHALQVTGKTILFKFSTGFNLIFGPFMILASTAFLLGTLGFSVILFDLHPELVVKLFNDLHELHVIENIDYFQGTFS